MRAKNTQMVGSQCRVVHKLTFVLLLYSLLILQPMIVGFIASCWRIVALPSFPTSMTQPSE
jgi:hypothetical protein